MGISAFDTIAKSYDTVFTTSPIGSRQRTQVYSHLVSILNTLPGKKILELGCGTGEDAIWLAQRAFSVTALDNSSEMIKIAIDKTKRAGLQSLITYLPLSISSLEQLPEDHQFDLIFSNFGPLNCIEPKHFPSLAWSLWERLTPGGQFVAVIMNKFCLWESLYFTAKGAFAKVFRRMTNRGVTAPIDNGINIMTWYFSPASFFRFFKPYFKQQGVFPIGFFVPPSYMAKIHQGKSDKWLQLLDSLDQHNPFQKISSTASDHFFIHLIKK